MKKLIILLAAMFTGTSQTNYSRETISKPHGLEAKIVLLEKGNVSLGINENVFEGFPAAALVEDIIIPDNAEPNRPPFLGNSFNGFKEALAFQESRGDYFAINCFGYLGKYQFGKGTLAVLGVIDSEAFLNNPKLQEEVFMANLARNKWILRREIIKYSNQELQTIIISESGILAAAHLAGPGNVKKYLRSGGLQDVQDAYGTQISDYLKKFAGYDLSNTILMPYRDKGIQGTSELAGIQLETENDLQFSDKNKARP